MGVFQLDQHYKGNWCIFYLKIKSVQNQVVWFFSQYCGFLSVIGCRIWEIASLVSWDKPNLWAVKYFLIHEVTKECFGFELKCSLVTTCWLPGGHKCNRCILIWILLLLHFHVGHRAHNEITCIVRDFRQGRLVLNRSRQIVHLPEMTISSFDRDRHVNLYTLISTVEHKQLPWLPFSQVWTWSFLFHDVAKRVRPMRVRSV